MPAYAVIGGQWGDEGKGKVIDYLAGEVDSVVRYAGGNNAGHTVVNDNGTFQLHLVPSGICWPDVSGIIGNGVVVAPDVLVSELSEISARGIDTSKLFISERAHVIMPYHVVLDRLEEEARGEAAIGTTGRGIGPAYMDNTGRMGIRVGDLLDWDALVPLVEQTQKCPDHQDLRRATLSIGRSARQMPTLGRADDTLRETNRANRSGSLGPKQEGTP